MGRGLHNIRTQARLDPVDSGLVPRDNDAC